MISEVTDSQQKLRLGDKVRLKPEYSPIESVEPGEIGKVIFVDDIPEIGPVYQIAVRFKRRDVGRMPHEFYELC